MEILKVSIMATIKVIGLTPGLPTYNNRFLFFIAVILPFIPIYKYSETIDEKSISLVLLFYLVFYLMLNLILIRFIKKVGKRWSEDEYKNLRPDQITFPFILVMMINTLFHFGLFYLTVKMIY